MHTISFRIDSEYFKKEYLLGDKLLSKKGCKKLVNLSKRIDVGFVGPMTSFYRETGITLIQTKNINSFFISDSDSIKITETFHKELKKSQINYKDILIARSGSFGKASIYLEKPTVNSSDIIIIEPNEECVNPLYLTAFLNTQSGMNQMIRFASGGLQGHVNLTIIEELEVPILEIGFQSKIEEIVLKSYYYKIESSQKYNSAETLLLSTIGLSNFKSSNEPVNVKSFKDSFLATGRLDAEYYQKKYDIIEKIIRDQKHKAIKEIRTENFRGMQPIYVENGDLDVINSKHILEYALDYNAFEKTSNKYWDIQNRARVFKGDILTYTTGANIGRTQVYQIDKRAIASNHVNIIRLKEENPFYVGFVLNSLVGRMQTEKYSAGSAQAELYPKDLDEFLIPIIDYPTQEKIAALVEESFTLKKQSEQLLETAKRAVEIAIEQNEEAAFTHINNFKNIGK